MDYMDYEVILFERVQNAGNLEFSEGLAIADKISDLFE